MGGIVSFWVTTKQAAWLDEKRNKSKYLQDLIQKDITIKSDPDTIRKLIVEEENMIHQSKERLNSYFNKLSTIVEKETELQNAEKERMTNMLKEEERKKKEKIKKLESSPFFSEIKKMKVYDDEKAMKIVEKCRKAGNRDFGTYDIKEYVEGRK
jgi:hypothetical protein